MKNLKRVFSLVLVLVLALGLFVTASAQNAKLDYKDREDIKFEEAVDVLTGIGILEGFSDGTFKPEANVTRAQAAKILSYLLLGKATADELKANDAPFPDVAADHWAAGYIQYCANQGIIIGYPDGNFLPLANVKAAEFAKMLLVALGYGENGEFEGDSYKTAVAKYASATRADLFSGNYAANLDAAATREEAALYAFNAMFAPKVIYSALLGDYLAEGTIQSSFGSTTTSVGTFAQDYNLSRAVGPIVYNNGYRVGNVRNVPADHDDIGRPVYVWAQGVSYVAGPYDTGIVLATKWDGTTLDDWTRRYNGKYNNPFFVAPAAENIQFWLDGEQVAESAIEYRAGWKYELIDTAPFGDIDIVLVTSYIAASMGDKPVVENPNGTLSVYVGANALLATGEKQMFEGFDKLNPYDVIVYNFNKATQTYYASLADAVEGQKTVQNRHDATITFAGFVYGDSAIDRTNVAYPTDIINNGTEGMAFNVDSIIFLDKAGRVICYDQNTYVAPNYAVLVDAAPYTTTGLHGGTTYDALLVMPDGKVEEVKLNQLTTVAGNTYKVADDTLAAIFNGPDCLSDNDKFGLNNKWYTYSVNANGSYNLVEVDAPIYANDITSGKVKFNDTTLSNSLTTFIVATMKGPNVSYAVYTGYAKVPTITADPDDVLSQSILGAFGVARYVFINATGSVATGDVVTAYAFITDDYFYTTYPDKTTNAELYVYPAIINGAMGSLTALDTTTIQSGMIGVYEITYDVNGRVAAIGENDLFVNYTNDAETPLQIVSNDLLKVGADAYAYNTKTVAYIYLNGELQVGTVADVTPYQNFATYTSVKRGSKDPAQAVAYQTAVELYVVIWTD